MRIEFYSLSLGLLSCGLLVAQDAAVQTQAAQEPQASKSMAWTQWNGPGHDGVSAETDWQSEGAEKSLWEAELGLGYSTASVQDGLLVTMGYDKEKGLDSVFCFDAISGELQWQHSYPSEIWDRAHEGGTVNTPSFDGDVVISLNREGNLYALDAKTGEVRWHNFLKPEENPHKLEYPTWGFSASPTVLEDGLFVNCGRVLSIDRKTGKVLWASEDFGDGYGTPLVMDFGERPCLAVLNGNGLGIVDRTDGKTVAFHEYAGKQRGINASTPVKVQDQLFIASGTIPGCAMLTLDDDGLKPVWENREMVTSFSGCVAMGAHLYGFDQKILKCIDAAGETKWQQRGIGNGAVSGAGERLLVMGGDGALQVVKATPASYEVLSSVALFDAGRYWTKPVLVDGIIYCRSSKGKMVARDHRQK